MIKLAGFDKLVVGFSGGLDSTVLLHKLAQDANLRDKLVAVHVNHQISPNAYSWQQHCQKFCSELHIPFIAEAVTIDTTCNVEEHARDARYAVFSAYVADKDCLVLAHHQDDQAETVLLQLFRGAGIEGLSAMSEMMSWHNACLVRPLLAFGKQELLDYAKAHQLQWIEDESNFSSVYTRNFVRQDLMPLLNARWPSVANTLARTAQHCQQAKSNLDALALHDCEQLKQKSNELDLNDLMHLSRERVNNILRFWLRQHQIQQPATATFNRLMDELIDARADANPVVAWDDIELKRYRNRIYLSQAKIQNEPEVMIWRNFPENLAFGSKGLFLTAKKANEGLNVPENAEIKVCFRVGGEDFNWRGQTKKLKKLVQEWGIPPWERNEIPLIYINDVLAMVVGYAISDLFFTREGGYSVKLC